MPILGKVLVAGILLLIGMDGFWRVQVHRAAQLKDELAFEKLETLDTMHPISDLAAQKRADKIWSWFYEKPNPAYFDLAYNVAKQQAELQNTHLWHSRAAFLAVEGHIYANDNLPKPDRFGEPATNGTAE